MHVEVLLIFKTTLKFIYGSCNSNKELCYRLNVYVAPNPYVETSPPV